jgi:hypothetical protein
VVADYLFIDLLFSFHNNMSTEPLRPEYLHKEELQYELQARGVPVADLNVADLRPAFRAFRNTEVNQLLLKNNYIFLEPSKYVTFCSGKVTVLKDLVENTDPIRIASDFPRYVHRLRHWDTRLVHFLQHADLDSASKLEVETTRAELRTLLDFTSFQPTPFILGQLDDQNATAFSQGGPSNPGEVAACPEQLAGAPHMAPNPQVTEPHTSPHSALGFHPVIRSPPEPKAIPHSGPVPNSVGSPHAVLATSLSFEKLPNPFQRFFAQLTVMDGFDISSLVNYLCVLVRVRGFMAGSLVQPAQVLQVLYRFTKGPLASINARAIRQQLTLDSYDQELLSFFFPPRVMLPLLQARYFRSQRPGEALSEYICNIKEMAAVFCQDSDESTVVRTVLDGLHSQERNRLVFCGRPCSFFRFDPANKLLLGDCEMPAEFGSACTTEIISPDLSHLSGSQFYKISDIIAEFSDVLTSKLGLTRILEYDIQLSNCTPVKLPPCRLVPPRWLYCA